jgi:gluconate kinase
MLTAMAQKTKPCIISCSSLKPEIQKLVKQGDLDADAIFVSKYFHVDYSLIAQNLRPIIQQNLARYPEGIVLVYGDLCLGPNEEMKQLAAEYGIVKVDALNCTDCLLGGKGKISEADPNHELLILHPGMNDFFTRVKETARQEGIDEESLKNLFAGLKGIVFLDSLGDGEKSREEVDKMDMGLPLLETRAIGLENLMQVLSEAMERNRRLKRTN